MKIEVRKAREPLPVKSMEAQDPPSDLGGLSNEFTSESPAHDKADISSEGEELEREFRPVDPYVFVKASRKYLAQNPPETSHIADFAAGLSTAQLRACKSHVDKQARAFEYFLVVVTSMYYGDPYCGSKRKPKEETCLSKNGCKVPRRRREKVHDNVLSTLISPLRQQFNFEEWTPRELAIFEASLCAFGKRFEKISALMNHSKSLAQINALYYDWKTTSHYKYWKEAVIRENW